MCLDFLTERPLRSADHGPFRACEVNAGHHKSSLTSYVHQTGSATLTFHIDQRILSPMVNTSLGNVSLIAANKH